ncbi:DoxX family protein [Pelagerythrobacter marensis]|uniref:DoxX family protein n=1 Tax=Pelagerythrobacter marensis TaxID=543877 RepID=A0ABZ2D4R2_9SPHN
MSTIAAIIGRIMLAAIFILSGLNKVIDPAATAEYIEGATTLPGSLALPTGVFELVLGLMLAIGLMTRISAILLAAFSLLTIFFFHNQFGDQQQLTAALKNLAMAGGLLVVFAYGQMRGSFDHMRERNRARKAELRAAHAEGKAEGMAATGAD